MRNPTETGKKAFKKKKSTTKHLKWKIKRAGFASFAFDLNSLIMCGGCVLQGKTTAGNFIVQVL